MEKPQEQIVFDEKKITEQVKKDLNDGNYGEIKIEKRGENNSVDVVATKRVRIDPVKKDDKKPENKRGKYSQK